MKLFHKRDLFLYSIVAVLLAASTFAFLPHTTSSCVKAVIRKQGTTVSEHNLTTAHNETLSYGAVTIEIQKGRIRFSSSDCPDQICTKTGWLTKAGTTAVCVPNQISITLEDSQDETILSY